MTSEFIIRANTSSAAEKATIALINAGLKVKTIDVHYNVHKGLPHEDDYKHYPLIINGDFHGCKTKVFVYNVSAGYGGSGPTAMVNILKAAGFRFVEEDILTKQCLDRHGNIDLSYGYLIYLD